MMAIFSIPRLFSVKFCVLFSWQSRFLFRLHFCFCPCLMLFLRSPLTVLFSSVTSHKCTKIDPNRDHSNSTGVTNQLGLSLQHPKQEWTPHSDTSLAFSAFHLLCINCLQETPLNPLSSFQIASCCEEEREWQMIEVLKSWSLQTRNGYETEKRYQNKPSRSFPRSRTNRGTPHIQFRSRRFIHSLRAGYDLLFSLHALCEVPSFSNVSKMSLIRKSWSRAPSWFLCFRSRILVVVGVYIRWKRDVDSENGSKMLSFVRR